MQERQVFEYAMIRVVPQVERGECLNVGVILFCKPARFLGMKIHVDEARLRALSARLDIGELQDYLAAWEQICEGSREAGVIGSLGQAERFRWLTATKSTILQCSAVHPGLCGNPGETLERLFRELVLPAEPDS